MKEKLHKYIEKFKNYNTTKRIITILGFVIILSCIAFALTVIIAAINYQEPTEETWPPEKKKPIIYLYPEKETKISVTVDNPERLTTTYPIYNNGWKVTAFSDGTLTDGNREYYALYYEATGKVKMTNEGFVIKGSDTKEFLEDKLSQLGLTDREAEEFIIYWLPVLEKNKYNYIRFEEPDIKLTVIPEPTTSIRFIMIYKGLNTPIKVQEQKLSAPERRGFVLVEWGGTEI